MTIKGSNPLSLSIYIILALSIFFFMLTGLTKAFADSDLWPLVNMGSIKQGLYWASWDYSYFLGGIAYLKIYNLYKY